MRIVSSGIHAILLASCFGATALVAASTPRTALLVLDKRDNSLAIVDPTTLKVVGRAAAGPDPHEVIASTDGRTAYVSNYGGTDSSLHTISVVDLVGQKALPAIDLGALHSAHGLAFADGKLYFTAETNKVIGRYDPSTHRIDWVLGLGQDRTHMIVVGKNGKQIFTSNVNSDTISIIEERASSNNLGPPPGGGGPGGPPPGPGNGARTPNWEVTDVSVGKGPEGFDVSPDGKEIWAANSHDGTVSIIDVASKKVIQTVDARVTFANRLKFTPDGKYVLVSSLGNGDLTIFDGSSRREVKRIKLGRGAAGILMQPDNSRAYIACSPDNSVAVVDLKTFAVVDRIEAGHEPDGMAWAVRE